MISFAQNFEDVIISRVFRGRLSGSYVDVGAHFPIIDSVTEHFYRLGWRGINVEPLDAAYSELVVTRSEDINIHCAIGAEDGSAQFFALDGFSTLEADVADAHLATGLSSHALVVETLKLSTVLERSGIEHIDFLKVDVEGAEGIVLRSNDWKRFRPSLVLVEAIHPVTRAASHEEWEWILHEAKYEFVYFDGLNRFYWDRDRPPPDADCFLPPNVLDNFTLYAQLSAETRASDAARAIQYEKRHAAEAEAGAARQLEEASRHVMEVGAAMQRLARGEDEPAPNAFLGKGWQAIADALRTAADGQASVERKWLGEIGAAMRRLAQNDEEAAPHMSLEPGWRALLDARAAASQQQKSDEQARLEAINTAMQRFAEGNIEPAPHLSLQSGWQALSDAHAAAGEQRKSDEQARLKAVDAAIQRFAEGTIEPVPHGLLEHGWRALLDARAAVVQRQKAHEQAQLEAIDAALERLAQSKDEPPPHPLLTSGWKSIKDEHDAIITAHGEAQARETSKLDDLQSGLDSMRQACQELRTLLAVSEQRRLSLLESRELAGIARTMTIEETRPLEEPIPPALDKSHVDDCARVHATRQDLMRALPIPPHVRVAEIGVALGDFSIFILENLCPKHFFAFDIFEMHKTIMHWGVDSHKVFGGLKHEDFYRQRFSEFSKIMTIEVGDSRRTLSAYPDEFFDLIYIDAGHTYDHVKHDAETALKKLTKEGIIIFNDYIMYDHHLGAAYGVVRAVNELVIEHKLRVIGFGLQQSMFCDIAICKPDDVGPKRLPVMPAVAVTPQRY